MPVFMLLRKDVLLLYDMYASGDVESGLKSRSDVQEEVYGYCHTKNH